MSFAVSANTLWAISLGIGLVAALVVGALLAILVRTVDDIGSSVGALLGVVAMRARMLATTRSATVAEPCTN